MDVALGPSVEHMEGMFAKSVLILVVMDVALGHKNRLHLGGKYVVLILVVMDVALGLLTPKLKVSYYMVLILVVMDVALGQVFSQTLRNQ